MIELQEQVVTQLLRRHGRTIDTFLDLGCGAGAMSRLVLRSRPQSHGVLVDFSEVMLARAKTRLADVRSHICLLHGDLSDPDWLTMPSAHRYDAVVSGLAIHHLSSERKRALFAEILALLEPGGIFINMDYVVIQGPLRSLFDKCMHANAVRAERESGSARAAHEIDLDDGEDRPDGVEQQLGWLRDAGFEDVEVHFKWAEAAIFGGVSPRRQARRQSSRGIIGRYGVI